MITSEDYINWVRDGIRLTKITFTAQEFINARILSIMDYMGISEDTRDLWIDQENISF